MLEVRGLNAWYGESHILHGMDFEVAEGEVVTLLGRNGAGKTTTLKSIMGMVGRRQGSIRFKEREITETPPQEIVSMGVAQLASDVATTTEFLEVLNAPNESDESAALAMLAWRWVAVQRDLVPHLVHLKDDERDLVALLDDLYDTWGYRKVLLFANSRSRCDRLFALVQHEGAT